MTFAIEYLDEQLSHIRAGKANPKILDCVRVMYYGAPVPLTNVATVTVPDARTIMITPWEKKIIKDIEKGIMDSEVGITPENNGEVIRLGIPPLTEERRRQLAKQSKQEAETAKISVRNARRDAIEQLKKSIKTDGTPEDVEKDAEAEVQKVHDKYIMPPYTTDFAILFFPFEGVYTEVLQTGIVEELMVKYRITVAGPSTLGAILNGLQVGFRSVALDEKTEEVRQALSGAGEEVKRFEACLLDLQKRLDQSNKELEQLMGVRLRKLKKKLEYFDI